MKSWARIGIYAILTMSTAAVFAGPAIAETLVVAAQRTPEGFDGDALRPGTQEVIVQTYEGLLAYARNKDDKSEVTLDSSKYEPHLAESWKISDDGKTVTFKLREGVKSPAGNELTAADVVWGFRKSMAQKRTGAFLMDLAKVKDVVEVSRYVVTYNLSEPSALLFPILTLYMPSIYDSAVMKKNATAEDPWALRYMESHTAGFGAYNLESVSPDEMAVFVANPNYFKGVPYYDRVIYRAIPSAGSRALLLRSGQAQLAQALPIQQVEQLRTAPNLHIYAKPHRGAGALAMNEKFPPFDDVRVRRAVSYAIDRDAINQAVFAGRGTVANTIIPPYIAGGLDNYPYAPRDISKAKALLAEAGHPNGLDVELIFADQVGWEEPTAIQAQAQLAQAGIRVTLKKITPAELRTRNTIARRDLPFHLAEDGPIVLDGGYTLAIIARSAASSNRSGYSSPELDALIDKVNSTYDAQQHAQLLKEAQTKWLDSATYALTAFRPLFEVMPSNIKGFAWHPVEHVIWADLYRTK